MGNRNEITSSTAANQVPSSFSATISMIRETGNNNTKIITQKTNTPKTVRTVSAMVLWSLRGMVATGIPRSLKAIPNLFSEVTYSPL